MAKKPRQQRLPGTVNSIPELDEAGIKYAAIRDSRMELTRREVALKNKVHEAMKKHKLKTYKYGEVEIEVVQGEEDVKVHVKKPKEQPAEGQEE